VQRTGQGGRWFKILSLLALLSAFFADFSTAGVAAASPSGRIYVSGRQHVRLASWAKAQGLEVSWLTRNKVLQLSGRSNRIVVTINSREARVNGITVWLLFPIVQQGGYVYLSHSDTLNTFGPLLAPGKGSRIRTVCLDAGHGGRDPGNRSGSRYEKTHTLLLANEVGNLLTKAGLKVVMTRSTDVYIDLESRPGIAQRRGADLFVSLHYNAAQSSRSLVKGAEVFAMTPAGAPSTNAQGEGAGTGSFPGNRNNDRSLLLAFHVQKSLVKSLYAEDRGVRRARFAVLRDAAMPAILVEAGFLSHPTEGGKIVSVEYRRQMARAIVDGILSYQKAVEPATRR
jgi:N-acetylmuramoyl-L-alanine amidase